MAFRVSALPGGGYLVDPPGDGDCGWWAMLSALRVLASAGLVTSLGVPRTPAALRALVRQQPDRPADDHRFAAEREATDMHVAIFRCVVAFDAVSFGDGAWFGLLKYWCSVLSSWLDNPRSAAVTPFGEYGFIGCWLPPLFGPTP